MLSCTSPPNVLIPFPPTVPPLCTTKAPSLALFLSLLFPSCLPSLGFFLGSGLESPFLMGFMKGLCFSDFLWRYLSVCGGFS
jgi:hypothetical protein